MKFINIDTDFFNLYLFYKYLRAQILPWIDIAFGFEALRAGMLTIKAQDIGEELHVCFEFMEYEYHNFMIIFIIMINLSLGSKKYLF